MTQRKTKPRKKQRIVLGVGYPWFTASKMDGLGFTEVALTNLTDGYGESVRLKIGKAGGWKKFKLVLEAV